MSEIVSVDAEAWLSEADGNRAEYEVRRAMMAILHAIASAPGLSGRMMIKGGILLALGYHTGRHTKDIDFSTAKRVQEEDYEEILTQLDHALIAERARDESVFCRVQSHRLKPPNTDASFPTLRISIGYAFEGERQFARMVQGRDSSKTIVVDLSFNERACYPAAISLGDGSLLAYSLHDQIAEKYRAIVQQAPERRNRVRRQDAYDIFAVLRQGYLSTRQDREMLLTAMRVKFSDRGVRLDREVINQPEIEECCRREYAQLENEVADVLPEFSVVFATVKRFYFDLPWEEDQ